MATFADVELVAVEQGEPPDSYHVVFDVVYDEETWCRSLVAVHAAVSVGLGDDQDEVVRTARDSLVRLLLAEAGPVSLHIRLTLDGPVVLARANPR